MKSIKHQADFVAKSVVGEILASSYGSKTLLNNEFKCTLISKILVLSDGY